MHFVVSICELDIKSIHIQVEVKIITKSKDQNG